MAIYYSNPLATHLPESVIITWLMELLIALHCLHSIGMIHRDVKAANIVLAIPGGRFQNAKALLIDFGISV